MLCAEYIRSSGKRKTTMRTLFHFLFHGNFGSTPHPRQKSGSTKDDVRKGKGYYSNKRKISAKRDKDKKILTCPPNILAIGAGKILGAKRPKFGAEGAVLEISSDFSENLFLKNAITSKNCGI